MVEHVTIVIDAMFRCGVVYSVCTIYTTYELSYEHCEILNVLMNEWIEDSTPDFFLEKIEPSDR